MNFRKTLIQMEYLERGLVPPGMNVKETLEHMSPSAARKAKRKFRKLHRNIKKEAIKLAESKKTRRNFASRENSNHYHYHVVRRKWRENMCSERVIEIQSRHGRKGEDPTTPQRIHRQRMVHCKFVKLVDSNGES